MRARRHIGLSLGKLGSLMDGLGEYSSQLCKHIAQVAPEWRERWGVQFHVHMPQQWHGAFGSEFEYLAVRPWDSHLHVTRHRFDVWHTLHQLGRIDAPWGTRHAILTIHDLNPIYHDEASHAQRWLQALKSRLTGVGTLTTMTRYVEADIRRHLDWSGAVQVIPNGVRDLTFLPRTRPAGVDDRPFFFHLSRLGRSKNVDLLLELAAHWPDHQMVFAGPRSGDSQRLAQAAAARGFGNVQVLESITDEEKAWLFAHCDAFLFPSQTEGFGLPPLEAMHFGKPVFLSTRTCLPEVGGGAAAYWPALEPEAMQQVMRQELPFRKTQAQQIRSHALKYNWEAASTAYLRLYQQLLSLA